MARARRAIPMIAFPRVRTIYIVSPTRVCVVYVVKEVTSFPGARSIMGVARNRTRARTQQEESCL